MTVVSSRMPFSQVRESRGHGAANMVANSYSFLFLGDDVDAKFTIIPLTGLIQTTSSPLDRETRDSYTLTVIAMDSGTPPNTVSSSSTQHTMFPHYVPLPPHTLHYHISLPPPRTSHYHLPPPTSTHSTIPQGTAVVRVQLSDRNDEAPIFLNTPLVFSVEEPTDRQLFITDLQTSDRDEGANADAMFFISYGNDGDVFTLNPGTVRELVAYTPAQQCMNQKHTVHITALIGDHE